MNKDAQPSVRVHNTPHVPQLAREACTANGILYCQCVNTAVQKVNLLLTFHIGPGHVHVHCITTLPKNFARS